MKTREYLLGALIVSFAASAASAQTSFRAELDGNKTVPPAPTTATGECEGTLNAEETEFTFSCSHDLLDATKGHVHRGSVTDPPSSDTVAFSFAETDCCPESTTWELTAEDVEDLFAGQLYVNIHSEQYSSEAIRGAFEKDVPDDGTEDPVVTPRAGVCGASGAAAILMTFCGLCTLRAGRSRR